MIIDRLDDHDIQRLGTTLADAYRRGGLVGGDVDLCRVASMEDAVAVQDAAVIAHGGDPLGYGLAATTPLTARLLGSDEPIRGPLLPERVLASGASFRLGPGVLGLGAQLAFVFGRTPDPRGGLVDIVDAVAACHLGLQVLGRRVPHSAPLNRPAGWADLGLTEAYVQGPAVPNWRERLRVDAGIDVALDGHVCARGRTGPGAGEALAPLGWLVRQLGTVDRVVEPGDIVTTGSLTGLLQVRPGHVASARFGGLGSVAATLT